MSLRMIIFVIIIIIIIIIIIDDNACSQSVLINIMQAHSEF